MCEGAASCNTHQQRESASKTTQAACVQGARAKASAARQHAQAKCRRGTRDECSKTRRRDQATLKSFGPRLTSSMSPVLVPQYINSSFSSIVIDVTTRLSWPRCASVGRILRFFRSNSLHACARAGHARASGQISASECTHAHAFRFTQLRQNAQLTTRAGCTGRRSRGSRCCR